MCKNDIDDQIEIDDFAFVESTTQNDIDYFLSPADGYIKVSENCQIHDNDVTNVPVDGHVRVQGDRHVQTNSDFILSPVDGYVRVTKNRLDNDVTIIPVDGYVSVLSDRQVQKQHDPAIIENTDVLGNTQDLTAMNPVERNLQVHGSKNTSQLLPQGISKITELTLDLFDNNYHLYALQNKPL